jgi:hypothetical protein
LGSFIAAAASDGASGTIATASAASNGIFRVSISDLLSGVNKDIAPRMIGFDDSDEKWIISIETID